MVGPTPLKNMSSSVGMLTFPVYENVFHSFHSSRAKDMQAAQIFVTSPRWLSNGIAPIAFAESQFSSFSNQNSSSSNHRSGGFCTARPPSRPKVKGDWKLEDRIFIPGVEAGAEVENLRKIFAHSLDSTSLQPSSVSSSHYS